MQFEGCFGRDQALLVLSDEVGAVLWIAYDHAIEDDLVQQWRVGVEGGQRIS